MPANPKPTALGAYLANSAAIQAKLAQLQQIADDHLVITPMLSTGNMLATWTGPKPGWMNYWRFLPATDRDVHNLDTL